MSRSNKTHLKNIFIVEGEEDEGGGCREEVEDEENPHRKFFRRNVPLYLPRIVIPRQGSIG